MLRGRTCVRIVTNTYPNWKFKVLRVPIVFGKLNIHFTFNVTIVEMVCTQYKTYMSLILHEIKIIKVGFSPFVPKEAMKTFNDFLKHSFVYMNIGECVCQ